MSDQWDSGHWPVTVGWEPRSAADPQSYSDCLIERSVVVPQLLQT